MHLIQKSEPVLRDRELLDLDIANVLCTVDRSFGKEEALAFVKSFFTADKNELSQRSAALADMADCPVDDFAKALSALIALPEEDGKYKRSITRVGEVLYLWRRATTYLLALDSFSALMPAAPESERIAGLKALLETFTADSTALRDAVAQTSELLTLPRYFYVGVNVKEDATPTEYGFIGQGTEERPLNSLLAAADPKARADSLSPEFVYNRNLFGFHFDEYIDRCLEKEWKNQLPKVKKLLLNTPLLHMEEFCALTEELSWLLVGLRVNSAVLDAGYEICRPLPGDDGLFAEDLRYPDLLLHRKGICGNNIVIENGHSIIITGANHSGKTSYLKTVGQTLLLAQLGFFVPAHAMRFTPVTGLYTLFSAGEDDSMDASRMGIEINKIQEICADARPGELILLNEPLTSTNPVEAVSICGDLCEGFLEKGITHLLVTHLYDIYFLLKARLSGEPRAKLHSLVTSSRFDASQGAMVHNYTLTEKEPEGNSYARETAGAYGITVPDMLAESADRALAETYLSANRSNSFYEGGNA